MFIEHLLSARRQDGRDQILVKDRSVAMNLQNRQSYLVNLKKKSQMSRNPSTHPLGSIFNMCLEPFSASSLV